MKRIFILILFVLSINLSAQKIGVIASSSEISNAQNLLLYSEQLENGNWDHTGGTVTVNQALDLTGGNTLDQITLEAAWRGISQIITGLIPGTTYSFSFDIKKGSVNGSYDYISYDVSNGWNTLYDVEYSTSITAGAVIRLTYSIALPAGCTSISVSPYVGSVVGHNANVGCVQLSLPGRPYVTTTNSIVP